MIEQKWTGWDAANTPIQLHNKMTRLQTAIKDWAAYRVWNITKKVTTYIDYLEWINMVKKIISSTDLENLVKCLIKKRYTNLSIMQEDI